MSVDVVIAGAEVVLEGRGVTPADIAIADGRIAAITARGGCGDADQVIDARGLHVPCPASSTRTSTSASVTPGRLGDREPGRRAGAA